MQAFARRERLLFIETSAKDASNVEDAFKQVLVQLANNVTNKGQMGGNSAQASEQSSVGPTPSTQVSEMPRLVILAWCASVLARSTMKQPERVLESLRACKSWLIAVHPSALRLLAAWPSRRVAAAAAEPCAATSCRTDTHRWRQGVLSSRVVAAQVSRIDLQKGKKAKRGGCCSS